MMILCSMYFYLAVQKFSWSYFQTLNGWFMFITLLYLILASLVSTCSFFYVQLCKKKVLPPTKNGGTPNSTVQECPIDATKWYHKLLWLLSILSTDLSAASCILLFVDPNSHEEDLYGNFSGFLMSVLDMMCTGIIRRPIHACASCSLMLFYTIYKGFDIVSRVGLDNLDYLSSHECMVNADCVLGIMIPIIVIPLTATMMGDIALIREYLLQVYGEAFTEMLSTSATTESEQSHKPSDKKRKILENGEPPNEEQETSSIEFVKGDDRDDSNTATKPVKRSKTLTVQSSPTKETDKATVLVETLGQLSKEDATKEEEEVCTPDQHKEKEDSEAPPTGMDKEDHMIANQQKKEK